MKSIWIAVAYCAFLAAGCATTESNPLEIRGRELRADIDRTYQRMVDARTLKINGMGRNFITDVVTKYIPPGTSFDDAETILRAAGFRVHPREPHPILPPPDKYDVNATIDKYAWTLFPPSKTEVWVTLRPKGPDDYSVVQRLVEADFVWSVF